MGKFHPASSYFLRTGIAMDQTKRADEAGGIYHMLNRAN
jgi:hypothetical protein